MKNLMALLALAFFMAGLGCGSEAAAAATTVARQQEDIEDWRRTRLYTGCRRVAGGASLLGEGAALMPDLLETLNTMIKSRLRAARIYAETSDLPHGLVLRVSAEVGDRGDGSSPIRLYRAEVSANRLMTVPLTGEETFTEVWYAANGTFGYASRITDIEVAVERSVSNSLDEFILAYLAANEEACENVSQP